MYFSVESNYKHVTIQAIKNEHDSSSRLSAESPVSAFSSRIDFVANETVLQSRNIITYFLLPTSIL